MRLRASPHPKFNHPFTSNNPFSSQTLANDVEPFLTLTSSPLIFNELTSENLTLIEHARLAGGYGVRDEGEELSRRVNSVRNPPTLPAPV